jgi:hypothetical protein
MLRTCLLVALVAVIFVVRRSDTVNLASLVPTNSAAGTGTGLTLNSGTSGNSLTGTGALVSSILDRNHCFHILMAKRPKLFYINYKYNSEKDFHVGTAKD